MHISKIAFKLIRLLSELLLLNGLNPKTPTSNQKSIFVHKLLFTRNKLGYLEYKARDNNEQIKYNSVFGEANFSFSSFFIRIQYRHASFAGKECYLNTKTNIRVAQIQIQIQMRKMEESRIKVTIVTFFPGSV